ncbi:hypothetical protein GDO86_019634 [Hymenochirus boettgeri]|uniref:C2H2-type domain-containing protein n=1 Tax=Hymenochirus boettgeri TaxID=247094 RepID=A0A8T2ICE6_9PIPI|nr:hypothetical protein GDO86_019634 [Hymenochirus boettgeri]
MNHMEISAVPSAVRDVSNLKRIHQLSDTIKSETDSVPVAETSRPWLGDISPPDVKAINSSNTSDAKTNPEGLAHHKALTKQESDTILEDQLKSKPSGFICDTCGLSFSVNQDLLSHRCTHRLIHAQSCKFKPEQTLICANPGKQNTIPPKSQTHQLIYSEPKYIPCPECGKEFPGMYRLKNHQIIHSGEKPFKCTQCGKAFLRKVALAEHQRIHTGEKPFRCTQCGKCFTRRRGLHSHQIVCNEEKPFVCTECGKRFSQKTLYLIHQNTHPPPCPDCGKTFQSKVEFKKHVKSHKK